MSSGFAVKRYDLFFQLAQGLRETLHQNLARDPNHLKGSQNAENDSSIKKNALHSQSNNLLEVCAGLRRIGTAFSRKSTGATRPGCEAIRLAIYENY